MSVLTEHSGKMKLFLTPSCDFAYREEIVYILCKFLVVFCESFEMSMFDFTVDKINGDSLISLCLTMLLQVSFSVLPTLPVQHGQ